MASFLGRLFSQNQSASFVRSAQPFVAGVNAYQDELAMRSTEELVSELAAIRARSGEGVSEEDLSRVFALVREAARRTLNEPHYDVQLVGGLVLFRGKIAEMRTGEGKTLVATLPATAHALTGGGVHIVTVNDYLARRDGAWMGQVYDALGLTVGVVTSAGAYRYDPSHVSREEDAARDELGAFKVFYDYLRPVTKREAYAADITYVTNNELGFDYLRDNTAYDPAQIVQRGHHYAIVDEVDSILIDEARTPLIISGPAGDSEKLYEKFAGIVASFAEGADYTVDEKQRAIQLTDEGMKKAEQALGMENLYTEGGIKYAHHLETAVRAKALFHKDKEYVVKDTPSGAEIVIVDEFTGRLQSGRRWSEGLHQAVEAKEGVPVKQETRTYATVTFQNLFRMYDKLAGMTGTAISSEEEFFTVYGLEAVAIPTNKPVVRKDFDDLIFQTAAGKYQAVVRAVQKLQEKNQPVLVGTVSIEDNEIVSKYLADAGIAHEVLNAKNHEREGEIIAQAGRRGRVTVATNLAGRGVDIKLGGAPATPEERAAVLEAGGLAVIGTERHDARRIDDQLRGRSGRQGDPGQTQFYISLEDKLMRVFASETLRRVMGTFNIPEDEPIESSMITKSIETAQKRIEGFNFDARKQVLAYDDVMNTQRLTMYARRRAALLGTPEEVEAMVRDLIGGEAAAQKALEEKKRELGAENVIGLLRRVILQVIDTFWLEHLEAMDYLRRSVSLRAYGQRDPLIEYRREGLARFRALEANIAATVRTTIPRIEPVEDARARAEEARVRSQLEAAGKEGSAGQTIRKNGAHGRNDLVTVKKGEETKTIKFKKAERLLSEGWEIIS